MKVIKIFLIPLAILLFTTGCGSKKIPKDLSNEELYNMAVEEISKDKGGFPWVFKGKDYDSIFKMLKEIQIRYSFSSYATLAELRTADAYLDRGEYEQAAIEYEEFIKRHPGHPEIPYATYQLGLSYYKQILSPDRDPTATREALKWFTTFVNDYPSSPLVPEAQERIRKCRNRLARREIYIGNFYSKRKNHKAAADRYQVVVTDYGDTKKYTEALYLLSRAYIRGEEFGLARSTLDTLAQQSPEDKYQRKAQDLLNELNKKESEYKAKSDSNQG